MTRFRRREIKRRSRILEAFEALRAKGLSQQQAARELGIGAATLWRYRKRIEPLTANCGRKTVFERFNPPERILALVRQLQLGGRSNADAWRAAGSDPSCPAELAAYLKATRYISSSLLRATKLTRRKATVIECDDFSLVKKFHVETGKGSQA